MSAIELFAENELTVAESEELAFHEKVVDDVKDGIEKLASIGDASLKVLRDKRLYRMTHKTFEEYCQKRFGFTRRYGNMRAAFADVIENLGTRVPNLPATEKQARPLAKLPTPELQAQAWEQAQADSGKDQPSNREVNDAVAKIQAELEIEKRRNSEWAAQNRQQILKIRELENHAMVLETRVDQLNAQSAPEPVTIEKIVAPADYETAKQQAAQLKDDLAKLRKKQDELVQQQVVAKLREREKELADLDRKARDAEALLQSLNKQIDSYSSVERMTRLQRDQIEKTRSTLAELAANLEGFDRLENDPKTDQLWAALADMLRNGALAIDFFRGVTMPLAMTGEAA